MEHTYYRIGEVSQVSGVSKDTLHFYSKIGLLVPDYIDANNQYRYYLYKMVDYLKKALIYGHTSRISN